MRHPYQTVTHVPGLFCYQSTRSVPSASGWPRARCSSHRGNVDRRWRTCSTSWAARSGTCISASGIRTGTACSSTWPVTCAAGLSLPGGWSRVMVSRWSFGMKSGRNPMRASRTSGRCVCHWSNSSGADSCMCRWPGPCGCGVGACTLTPKGRSWPAAGSNWGRSRSRPPSLLTGCARARQGVRRLPTAVQSAGSGWCAPCSSPGPEPPARQDGVGAGGMTEQTDAVRDRCRLPGGTEGGVSALSLHACPDTCRWWCRPPLVHAT
jgi:hypothetical protein